MLTKIRKLVLGKKGQSTLEYAGVIGAVAAFVAAMSLYFTRGFNAQGRDAIVFLREETQDIGGSLQYEPYYTNTDYTVTTDAEEAQIIGQRATTVGGESKALLSSTEDTKRTRTGTQRTEFKEVLGGIDTLGTGVAPTGL